MINNLYKIYINDLSIDFYFKERIERIKLAPGIIVNGYIEDENYLYYILNKFLKDNRVKNNIKAQLILNSSEIRHIEKYDYNLKEEELNSFLYYELNDILKGNIEHYEYRFIKNKRLKLSIFLIPKKMIDDYLDLFEKLHLSIEKINSINDIMFIENKDYNLNINETNAVISINNEEFIYSKTIFDNRFSEFIIKNNVDYEDIYYIIDKKEIELFTLEDKEIKDELQTLVENKLDILLNNIIYLDTKYVLSGNFSNKIVIDFLEREIKNIKYKDISRYNNEKINFVNQNQKKFNYLLLIPIIIICLNSLLYMNINQRIKRESLNLVDNKIVYEEQKNYIEKLNPEEIKKNSKEIKDIEKENAYWNNINLENKKYFEILEKLLEYKSDEILFTDFEYFKNSIYISGVSIDDAFLEKIENITGFKVKVISSDDIEEILHFKTKIDLGDL